MGIISAVQKSIDALDGMSSTVSVVREKQEEVNWAMLMSTLAQLDRKINGTVATVGQSKSEIELAIQMNKSHVDLAPVLEAVQNVERCLNFEAVLSSINRIRNEISVDMCTVVKQHTPQIDTNPI